MSSGRLLTDKTEPVSRQAVFDGFHAWKHAVRFGYQFTDAWTDDPERLGGLVESLAPDLVPRMAGVTIVSSDDLTARCAEAGLRSVHHTRVLAWGTVPQADPSLLTASFRAAVSSVPAVLVDGARHPGNLGAVIRVAAAVGAPVVFTVGGVDPWLPEVVRAAAGLHAAVAVMPVEDVDLIEGDVFVLDADGEPVSQVSFPAGSVLAVGAERHGVSAQVSARSELVVSLPMRDGVSSLNLATSVAAALYVHISKGTS